MRAAYAGQLPKPHSVVPLPENHRAWMVRACASAVLVGLENEGLDDILQAGTRDIESYRMETYHALRPRPLDGLVRCRMVISA